jgi:glycosyltransferase involved in cell wall biosynthesis
MDQSSLIDILVPTLNRAHKLNDVFKNISDNTVNPHTVVFITEEDDKASQEAGLAAGGMVVINTRTRSYPGAINSGYHATTSDWLFTANDDFDFKYGWDVAALAHYADGAFPVIGVNDNFNPSVQNRTNSTIHLVARWYLDTLGGVPDQGPKSFYFEGYFHNFVETEFIEVAKTRGKFFPCLDSHVHHLHWSGGLSEVDSTTIKTQANVNEDAQLFTKRTHLWNR